MSPDGGEPKKVVSGCIAQFLWSPDGNSIAIDRFNDRDEVVNLQNGGTLEFDEDSGH